jgi:hypothetical protein
VQKYAFGNQKRKKIKKFNNNNNKNQNQSHKLKNKKMHLIFLLINIQQTSQCKISVKNRPNKNIEKVTVNSNQSNNR